MSRALVVYGTKTGCTEGVAQAIGDTLRSAGLEADVKRAEDTASIEGYDAVFVGSGVRVGQWHASAKQWLGAHASSLSQIPVALFTVSLTMATTSEKADEVRAYTDPLLAETGIQPVSVGLFPGMNIPKSFSLPERLIMKAMKAPEGDFRDLQAVASWTRETAPRLGLL